MSAHDDLWAEALACALTGRTPTTPLPAGFPAAVGRKAEDELLYRIAALGTYRIAGALNLANGFASRPEAGDGDCPLAAAALLPSLMREPGDFPLARQWVEEAERRGLAVPFECAGHLAKTYEAKGIPLPVKAFGPWLAWAGKAAEGDHATAFGTATGAERASVLRAWRRHDPDAAREAVAATMAEEGAPARAALVACLDEGLSSGDEPFLEGVRKDRSGEVRAAAASVLVRLPGSAFSGGMARMARDHVGFDARGQLQVKVPDDLPLGEAWLSGQGVSCKGSASVRVAALVAAAPLDAWDASSPEGWLRAVGRTRWGDEIRAGWAIAARREANVTWARALSDALRSSMGGSTGPAAATIAMSVLPPGEWESAAAGLLQGCDLEGAMHLLAASPHPCWDATLTDAVVRNLPRMAERHARDRWAARISLDPVALSADPSCAPRLAAIAEGWDSEWMSALREQLRTVAATLERRRAIAASFSD